MATSSDTEPQEAQTGTASEDAREESSPIEDTGPDSAANETPADTEQETGTISGGNGRAFLPMLFGGVLAAVLGFGAAHLAVFTQDDAAIMAQLQEQQSRLDAQQEQIKEISSALDAARSALAALDLAPLRNADEALHRQIEDLIAGQEAMIGAREALDIRLGDLEKRPVSETIAPEAIAAYERELDALRQALQIERAEIETLAQDVIASQRRAALDLMQEENLSVLAELTRRLDAGQPYDEQLLALTSAGVSAPSALVQSATKGVATHADLLAEFPALARSALATARTAQGSSGGVKGFLQSQFNLRSTTPRAGDDPDAVLSRTEAALRGGDLSAALDEIAALPDEAQEDLAEWAARAGLRLEALNDAHALRKQLRQE